MLKRVETVRLFLFVVGLIAAVSRCIAADCIWIPGTGGRMNDSANWENGAVPGTGDVAIFTNMTAAAEVVNDLPSDVLLKAFKNSGGFELTVTGENPLRVGLMDKCVYSGIGGIVFECPVSIEYAQSTGSISVSDPASPLTFNDLCIVTGADDETLSHTLKIGTVVFNKGLYAPTTDVKNVGNCKHTFNGPLTAKTYTAGVYWTNGSGYINAAGGSCGTWRVGLSSEIHMETVPNVTCEDEVLTFEYQSYLNGSSSFAGGMYKFKGDQTFDHIVMPVPPLNKDGKYLNVCKILGSGTMTMKCSCDVDTYHYWGDSLSVVYDPVDDYTYSNNMRTNGMKGTITVKGGTFAVRNWAKFSNVPGIYVEGGVFELDTAADSPLSSVTMLKLGDGAVFRTGDSVAGSPMNSALNIHIAPTAKLQLSANTAISVPRVFLDGVPCPGGTFTGIGSDVEDATEVSWIEGSGTVTVTTPSTTFNGGDMSLAANWSGGLPDSGEVAIICAEDKSFDAVVPDGFEFPEETWIFGRNGNVATLTGNMNLTNKWINVGPGGKIDVPEGCEFFYSGIDAAGERFIPDSDVPSDKCSPIKIASGGEFSVSGGTVVITNFTGFFKVSGNDSACGILEATSGKFCIYGISSKDRIWVADKGRVTFSGDSELKTNAGSKNFAIFYGDGDATVTFTDSARASINGSITAPKSIVWNIFTPFLGEGDYSDFLIFGYNAESNEDSTFNISNAAIKVGYESAAIASPCPGYGHSNKKLKITMNILADGSLTVNGARQANRMPAGFLLGYAAQSKYDEIGWHHHGILNINGGALTNQIGHFVVGAGLAKGEINISDGVISSNFGDGTYRDGTVNNFVLGAWHGQGSLVIDGGSLEVACTAWIGGVHTNVFGMGYGYDRSGNQGFDMHDASGTLSLKSGDALFEKKVVLGADGSGLVEIAGSDGSFTAADFVFSNTVENAESGGTVKFTFDENGVVPIELSGKLAIGTNAKLVVDSASYPKDGRRVQLFSYDRLEGTFASVEVEGEFAENAKLVYGSDGIRMYTECSTFIMIK